MSKPPPHDAQAERSLIGAMLCSAEAVEAALESGIAPGHFYELTPSRFCAAAFAVQARGDRVDVVTVGNELRSSGQFHEDDGPAMTGFMADTTGGTSAAAARSYSKIVLEHAAARELAAAGHRMETEALAGNVQRARDVAEQVMADAIDAGPASGGLTPIDIGAVQLEGEPAVKAELLCCTDGQALLVRGGVTGIQGEPAAGKSWLTTEGSRQGMVAGERVAVLDYEGSERTWAERFNELAVAPATTSELLIYRRPGAISPHIVARALMRDRPSLVIVDSLAAALAEHDKSENEAADVLWFLRHLCRPLATAGAAVVVIDHVTKDQASRGKWGRGSGAKLGEFDVGYTLELVEPFARGHNGSSILRIAKDRHGVIGPEGKVAAEIRFGSNIGGRFRVELSPPSTAQVVPWDGPTECMAAVRRVLEEGGLEQTTSKLLAALKVIGLSFRRTTVQEAADRLARSPAEPITVRIGARSARWYRFDPDAVVLDLTAEEPF